MTEAPTSRSGLYERLYSRHSLPDDLQERAAHRLGWLALVLSISWLLVRAIALGIQLADQDPELVGSDLLIAVALVLSACMFALTRMRVVAPHRILDIGLVYAVGMAFLISLSESYAPWKPDDIMRGAPYVCWWLILWPMFVPTVANKTIAALLFSAMMAPIGLQVSIFWLGNPEPALRIYLLLFFTTVVAGIAGFIASRVIYQLSADIGRAREMGGYRLMTRIGVGGMGEVWSAEHKTLARPAAVKVIRKEALGSSRREIEVILTRFEREAKATAALRSPHTVVLYDYGTTEAGTFYYVMELLHGFELETLIKRFGPMPPERVAYILIQVCHSLNEAHQRNLIHRDIKPANVHLCHYGADFDFVKVLDFGLVKSEFEPKDAKLTKEGMTSGTPAFMAPEMARGKHDITPAADLYSLGCVAYFMLTGRLLFDAKSAMKMLLKQIDAQPIPVSQRSEYAVPRELEDIIMSCLAKDPEDRPKSAKAIAKRLEAIEFEPPWTEGRARRWWRTNVPGEGSLNIEPDTLVEEAEPAPVYSGHASIDRQPTDSLRKKA
jgi:serine/threonine-protein kinase